MADIASITAVARSTGHTAAQATSGSDPGGGTLFDAVLQLIGADSAATSRTGTAQTAAAGSAAGFVFLQPAQTKTPAAHGTSGKKETSQSAALSLIGKADKGNASPGGSAAADPAAFAMNAALQASPQAAGKAVAGDGTSAQSTSAADPGKASETPQQTADNTADQTQAKSGSVATDASINMVLTASAAAQSKAAAKTGAAPGTPQQTEGKAQAKSGATSAKQSASTRQNQAAGAQGNAKPAATSQQGTQKSSKQAQSDSKSDTPRTVLDMLLPQIQAMNAAATGNAKAGTPASQASSPKTGKQAKSQDANKHTGQTDAKGQASTPNILAAAATVQSASASAGKGNEKPAAADDDKARSIETIRAAASGDARAASGHAAADGKTAAHHEPAAGTLKNATPEQTASAGNTTSNAAGSAAPATPNANVHAATPPSVNAQPGFSSLPPAGQQAAAVHAQIHVGPQNHDGGGTATLDKLGVTIAAKSTDGIRHFDIRLDPPDLGRVQVHLSVDDSGKAQAHLVVDKPQTLQLLQRDATALNRTLTDAGLNLSNNGLNFTLRQQYRQNDGGGVDKGRGRPLSVTAVVQPDANLTQASIASFAPHSVRLDIRV